jgi:hypothetical protein
MRGNNEQQDGKREMKRFVARLEKQIRTNSR